jgi:hypothetical protein
MTFYSPRNLWTNDSQIRRIFGWADILREWNYTLKASTYITTLIDNLRATSDPKSTYDFPLSHFVTFLNDEQEGLKWLIYEIVAQRWMYADTPTEYLSELVHRVDVDTGFPSFVGSPLSSKTVREFLEENLSEDELEDVEMLPRLVHADNYTYFANQNPQINCANVNRTTATPPTTNKFPHSFQLRFLRPEHTNTNEASEDTVITISKAKDETYNMHFKDGSYKSTKTGLRREQLIRYLSVQLRSLAIDDDPYNSVQVMPPNAPSVLYLMDRINSSSTRDLIYDNLEISMEVWPTV